MIFNLVIIGALFFSVCVNIAMAIVIHCMRQEINELFTLLNDKRTAADPDELLKYIVKDPEPENKSAFEAIEDMKTDMQQLTEQIYRDRE